MKIAARIILAILFLYFLIGGLMAEDGFWKFCAAMTVLAACMYFILYFILILLVTAFPKSK